MPKWRWKVQNQSRKYTNKEKKLEKSMSFLITQGNGIFDKANNHLV